MKEIIVVQRFSRENLKSKLVPISFNRNPYPYNMTNQQGTSLAAYNRDAAQLQQQVQQNNYYQQASFQGYHVPPPNPHQFQTYSTHSSGPAHPDSFRASESHQGHAAPSANVSSHSFQVTAAQAVPFSTISPHATTAAHATASPHTIPHSAPPQIVQHQGIFDSNSQNQLGAIQKTPVFRQQDQEHDSESD